MKNKELTWEEVKEKLAFTPEENAEIQLEEERISAVVETRKNKIE